MERTAKDVIDAYRHVFAGPEADIVLKDLMAAHFITASTFQSPTDSYAMVAYREGGKNAVLRILSLANRSIEIQPE